MPLPLLLLLLLGASVASEARPLRHAIVEGNVAPYITEYRSDGRCQGLLADIAALVARDLQQPSVCIRVPRAELERTVIDGRADVIALFDPAWASGTQNLRHSKPYLIDNDLLITTANRAPGIGRLDQLHGLRIGGQRDYRYSDAFTAMVRAGDITRVDATSPAENFRALRDGRIDGFIYAHTLYYRARRSQPDMTRGTEHAALVMGRSTIGWSARPGPEGRRLLDALNRRIDDGSVQALINRYR